MSLWAVVPVKPLFRGKSRLASVLSRSERVQMNRAMLQHLLGVLDEVSEVAQVLVVSRDPAVLALARRYRARTLQEDSLPGLNLALRRATAMAQIYAASALLILPADLPLATPEEIRRIIQEAHFERGIVIVPDRRRQGTNALLVRPPGILEYQFGGRSFEAHLQQARQKNLEVRIVESPILGFDLDLPEDLEWLRQFNPMSVVP